MSQALKDSMPLGWINTTLGDISTIVYGKNLSTKSLKESGYPVFGANGIIGNYDNYHYDTEQVLISCRGAYSGKINMSPSKCFVTNNSLVVNLLGDLSENKKYFYYALNATKKDRLITGSAQPQVTINNAVLLTIPIAPLNEQKRIVAKIEQLFSDLDAGMETLQALKKQIKQYRQSVLKYAFEGKLTAEWRKKNNPEPASKLLDKIEKSRREKWEADRLRQMNEQDKLAKYDKWKASYKAPAKPDEIDLYELPKCWTWTTLGQLAWSVKDGPHYSPKYSVEGIPFISGGNVRPNGIDFDNTKYITPELHEELSKRCKPDMNDVLYTKGGTTGIARVNTYDIDFNVWVHVAVLKLTDHVYPFYLQNALNSPFCYMQSQKYTHGVGNQDLGLTRMVKIHLPIPSFEEQKQIVSEIERHFSIANKTEEVVNATLKQSNRLRQSILKRAFEGKLVPQDPTDEPAEKLMERIKREKG